MQYKYFSHRNAITILENEIEFLDSWQEIRHALTKITDEMLINTYQTHYQTKNKSLSTTINKLLKEEFKDLDWAVESPIFQDPYYDDKKSDYWRLDFAKKTISIEVAFNHGSATAWNLLKPVLASELNHVRKAIQTKLGIIIVATQNMKSAGNFDGAIGYYEKYIDHLKPLMNQLSVPLLIIGLEAPKTFHIKKTPKNHRFKGEIVLSNKFHT
ncbi:BglII/BstYI family type II restriction endonuclease [Peribacillus frigoritolerans]|uniref:BglII/BstYI family type II restriction endonuclease n=1 Tax=Peribacillus frigoritolerans TaxID=450367 RepID=UPI00222EDB8E|nr:BglII/BstYI family type II restriction endonuclease [Peribacillus frigoritolerans]UZD46004.1 BglII/BstYI family type II restriction endonuclease [Peribacillus frigoritolerans]